jgi:GDPmannose 4,6-dehydratase
LSFQQPVETLESIGIGTLNMLESIRFLDYPVKFYNAGSGECFGDTGGIAAVESTAFRPKSPYAVAKATAFWEVVNYRESYGLFACSGILFNHESPLRPPRFVTRKIINSAINISKGNREKLKLGDISISRDWGWAPEYVEAMWLMLQQDKADDFIVATGKNNSLREFINEAFSYFGLDWRDYVIIDSSLFRPSDIKFSLGNAAKAEKYLGWKACTNMEGVVSKMIEAEIKSR